MKKKFLFCIYSLICGVCCSLGLAIGSPLVAYAYGGELLKPVPDKRDPAQEDCRQQISERDTFYRVRSRLGNVFRLEQGVTIWEVRQILVTLHDDVVKAGNSEQNRRLYEDKK